MDHQPLGKTGLSVSPIGFGAFKIGRCLGAKYPGSYELPSEVDAAKLLNGVLDLGVNLIDTAPAYGLSEERIGHAISHRRDEFVLSSKVGETFGGGASTYNFSSTSVRASVERSLKRLKTTHLDCLLIHSNGDDLHILNNTDVVEVLCDLKAAGKTRAIGLSGKTNEGARQAMEWADVLMVEYNANDQSHAEVMADATTRGLGVVVKKGLASGHLPADESVRFVISNTDVASLIVGSLNLDHIAQNLAAAQEVLSSNVA